MAPPAVSPRTTFCAATTGAEGYCDEGIAYWNYGFGHAVLLAEYVARATAGQVPLLAGDKARRITAYPAHLEILPGVFPSFFDGDLTTRSSPFFAPWPSGNLE